MAQYAKRPWYPFYPIDFSEDENVTGMTDQEELAYRRLLDRTWLSKDCTLPDDEKALARMAKVTPRVWKRIRSRVLMVFPPLPRDPSDFAAPRRHNPRLTAEYNKTCGISRVRAAAAACRRNLLKDIKETAAIAQHVSSYPQSVDYGVDNPRVVGNIRPQVGNDGILTDNPKSVGNSRNPLDSNMDGVAIAEQSVSTVPSKTPYISHSTEKKESLDLDLDLTRVSTLIARDMPKVAPPLEIPEPGISPHEKYLTGALSFAPGDADHQRPWLDYRWRNSTTKLPSDEQVRIALLFREFYGFRADTGPAGWAGDHNQLSAVYKSAWQEYAKQRKAFDVAPIPVG